MSQRRSTLGPAGHHPVGRPARRLGLAVVAATLPVVVGVAAGLVADAGSLAAVVAALTGSLGAQSGSMWLLHAATLGLAGGGWLLGAGLLVEGLD